MIGGKAGEGIEVPGNMFARLCMHAGLWLHSTQEFYSVIKGYNSINQIRVSEKPVKSHSNHYDLVLAIDAETVERYLDLLEKVFVIFRVGGFSRNLRKEITRNARYYFYDNGVRNSLIQNFNSLNLRNDTGQLWENFLMVERLKALATS